MQSCRHSLSRIYLCQFYFNKCDGIMSKSSHSKGLKGRGSRGKQITGSLLPRQAIESSPVSSDQPVTRADRSSVLIKVLAKPGSKDNKITEISPEGVRIQIAAPPAEGQANAELIKYMSKCLKVSKAEISLKKGSKSHHKILVIDGTTDLTPSDVLEKLEKARDD